MEIKKEMKKVLLSLALILLPLAVSAVSQKIDGIYYNLNPTAKTAEVVFRVRYQYSGDIVIPASVTHEDIEYSVIGISANAFRGSSELTSVTIPSSVTSIGVGLFSGCTSLASVVIEEGNPNYDSRENCNAIIETASNTLIIGCKSSSIPNSVTTIGKDAFNGCTGLTSITIPNSVTTIGESSFSGCSGLTSLTIGNGVTTIGKDAFKDCSNMTKVELDNNAIVSKDYNGTPYISDIFGGQVKEYVFGEHVTRIGENAFSHNNLTSVTIPASVTNIGYCAFYQCFYLTDIHITDIAAWCRIQRESSSNGYYMNPFQVPYHLYLNNEEIKDMVIPDGVEVIEYSAFSGCSELTSVSIPNSVTSIGEKAFAGCVGLTSITLGNNVASIGQMAFFGCSGLTSITIPASVTNIGYSAFDNCIGLTAVHISDLGAWCSIEGAGSGSNPLEYAHHLYLNGEEIKNLVIPDGVTSIGNFAFTGGSELTSVTIPNSVTTIGDCAFYLCSSLTTIVIPNSVITIDAFAFSGNMNLTDVYCYAEMLQLNSDVFGYGYYSNATLHVPEGSLDAYRSAEWWMYFGSIVALTNSDPKPTGIKSVKSSEITEKRYYSLDGKHTSTPQRGLNIIRMSDGTTKKVILK